MSSPWRTYRFRRRTGNTFLTLFLDTSRFPPFTVMAPPKVDIASFTDMYTKGAEKLTGPFARLVLTELGLDRVPDDEAVVMLDECCGYGDPLDEQRQATSQEE